MKKTRGLPAIALTFLLAAPSLLAALDLGSLEFLVRPGFDPSWLALEPGQADPAWTRLPPGAGPPLLVRDLPVLSRAAPAFLGFAPGKIEEYCFLTAFTADPALAGSTQGLGLYLERIGQNWEVYLNGSLVRSELHLGAGGSILRYRSVSGELIHLDDRLIKPGRNILAFRIVGDPGSGSTGLASSGPYRLDSFESLLSAKAENFDLMLIGVYVFFALYHILLYGLRPRNRPYLFYGMGTLLVAGFLFSQTHAAYDLVADSRLVGGLELFCLFLLLPTFGAFLDLSQRNRLSRFTVLFGLPSAAMALVAPFAFQEGFLRIWQLSAVLPILNFLVFGIGRPLVDQLRSALADIETGARHRLSMAAGRMLFGSKLLVISLGATIVLGTLVFDIAHMSLGGKLQASKFGLLLLIFGIAAVLAEEHHHAHDQVEAMAANLEHKVASRTTEVEMAMREQAALNSRLYASNLKLQNAIDIAAKDMRIAIQVQQGIFPSKPPSTRDWDVAFALHPVSGVSGDFFDFYTDGDRLKGLVVGDVSGHGIASGLVTILARSVFWRNFRTLPDKSLGRVLEQVNSELIKELSSVENYLTCVFLRLEDGQVEYANAGHPEIMFRRAGKAGANLLVPRRVDDYKGPPIGREFIEAPYRAIKFRMAPGDSLLMCTDGLIESRNQQGHLFDSGSLITALARAPDGPAEDMLSYIIDEWRFHMDSHLAVDDITAVLIKRRA